MARSPSRLTRALAVPALLAGIAGCADVVTYSQNSQKEGVRLYADGQYADAAGAFRNATRQDPQNYEARYGLGNSYAQIGQYHQAIQAYEACLDIMQMTLRGKEDVRTRVACRDALAQAIAKSDDRATETASVEKRAHDSNAAEDYFILAKVYRDEGDADSAIEAYSQATLLAPKDFSMVKEFAMYLVQLNQSQRAEQPLKKAYALKSDDPEVNDALRQIGVVPGPSLKDQRALAQPLLPKGPLPEMHMPKFGGGAPAPAAEAPPAPAAPAPSAPSDAATPRD